MRPCSVRASAFFFVVVILLVLPPASMRCDPQTGRIRLLHIGDVFRRPGFASYFFFQDPRIVMFPVPSEVVFIGELEVFRYYRLYLPRTEESVRNDFDVICCAGCYHHHLGGSFLSWARGAVVEEGVGFLMADDPTSFGGRGNNPNWAETVLGEVLPVTCRKGRDWTDLPFKLDIVMPDHPLVKGMPWDEAWFVAHNRVYDKPGATVVARTAMNPVGLPALAYMDMGQGVSVALVHDWGGRAGWALVPTGIWAWAPHFFCSLVYYSAQAEIPDPAMDKTVREKLFTYLSERLLALSFIDFADRFGANTMLLFRELGEIDQKKLAADRLYAVMELVECSEQMDVLISSMKSLSDKALRAKDRALLWIYLSEWFVVTGTMLLSGYTIYMLMIRRKLFRDVAQTRFRM